MSNAQSMTTHEYARHRVESVRRELNRLNASVELTTNEGKQLSEILISAINDVEALGDSMDAGVS